MHNVTPLTPTYSAGNAEVYERLMGRWSRRLALPFLRFAAIGEPAQVLDVGCGTGSLTAALAHALPGATITGIDASAAFIEHARRQGSHARLVFQQADATALPFNDGQFAATLSLLVLNFVPDFEKAAREMARVTRHGGVVAAAVWDFPGGFTSYRMLLDTIAVLDLKGAELRAKVLGAPLTAPGELADLWTRIGLRAVEQSSLTMRFEFRSFADYWEPYLGGQGSMGPYLAGLSGEKKALIERHLRLAYLAGREDGPRSYAATAWAVRGVR
jgi:SAM-dependent methyltransferase